MWSSGSGGGGKPGGGAGVRAGGALGGVGAVGGPGGGLGVAGAGGGHGVVEDEAGARHQVPRVAVVDAAVVAEVVEEAAGGVEGGRPIEGQRAPDVVFEERRVREVDVRHCRLPRRRGYRRHPDARGGRGQFSPARVPATSPSSEERRVGTGCGSTCKYRGS